jgi:hypothetical protein
MEEFIGYAGEVIRYRVNKTYQKSLFGKMFWTYPRCMQLYEYFFQLGGILGGKYGSKKNEFFAPLYALSSSNENFDRVCTIGAQDILQNIIKSHTFFDYVNVKEFGCEVSDIPNAFAKNAVKKINKETVLDNCPKYLLEGMSLAIIHPDQFRRLFEETHKQPDKALLESARKGGMDVSGMEDVMTYEEAEKEESEAFMSFLKQCAPSSYVSLSSV